MNSVFFFKSWRIFSISLKKVKCRRLSLELISWGPYSSLERERKIRRCLPVVFTSSIKREIRYFQELVVQRRQWNVQKKVWRTCKIFVLLYKAIVFLTFSLPSPTSLVKLPIGLRLYLLTSQTFEVLSMEQDARKSPQECQEQPHTACVWSAKVKIHSALEKSHILTVPSPDDVARRAPLWRNKKIALYLSVNVFSTKVLIEDTVVTSTTVDGTVILRGHPSHAKLRSSRLQCEGTTFIS